MSPETPNVYHTSFIRKSLAAVSKIAHANASHPPTDISIRKPAVQSHRIFNLHLSPLNTSSPPRLASKVGDDTHKSTDLRGLINVDGSTLLDEDDSMYNEQNSGVFRAPLEQFNDEHSDLGLNDTLETDTSAADLPLAHGNNASPQTFLPPPGLNLHPPPKYPIIIPTQRILVPRPGVVVPAHWSPGGGCNVRLEPAPAMNFLPRPGTIPPSFWSPGGCATRLEEPVYDTSSVSAERSLDQDDTDGTMTNDISTAGVDDPTDTHGERTLDLPSNEKDHIHAQLEHILDMDDSVLSDAVLPGVYQSVWATCPTPPPSPNHSRSRLNRKQSHALLNYLLLECGYDLGALRKLEARFPIPRPDPEDVPQVDEPDFGTELTADDPEILNEVAEPITKDATLLSHQTPPALDALEGHGKSVRVNAEVLEDVLDDAERMDQCEAAVPELINLTIEQLTRTPEVHAYETMPRAMEGFREDITTLQPSVFIDCSNAPTGAHSKLLKALLDERNPARSSFPLRRSHSLPEAWRVSAFIVFDKPSPPSPTPAPKPKANNVYLHSTAMSSAESLAAPPQSGHSYLRSIKPLKNKVKTKTRPDTANVRSVVPPVKAVPLTRTYTGTMKKTSFMSRLRNRDGADDEDKPKAAPKPAGKWFNKLSTMSKTTAERMRVLVKGAPNARELSWKDFLKIMKELGFTWEEMDGTAIKFLPPDPRDPTITFHRPQEKVCHIKKLALMRKRLADTYGWTAEDILAALGVEN